MPKPLKKVLQKKKPTNVIINPDLDEKGSPVAESKIAYGVGYVAGSVLRGIGKAVAAGARAYKNEIVASATGKYPKKKKKLREALERKTKEYHQAVAKHHSTAARRLAKSPARSGTNMHALHKTLAKQHSDMAKTFVEDNQLDEISKRTVKLYQIKAGKDLRTGPASGNDRIRNALMKGRVKGMKTADKKMHGGAKVMATEAKQRRWIPRDPWKPDTDPTPFRGPDGKLKTRSKAYKDHIASEKAKFDKKNVKEGTELNELLGKGSIDTIGKHHAARSTKGKPNSKYHAIQRNRAARLRDIHKGTGPLGKTTMKGRMQYAKQDREEAAKHKPVSEGKSYSAYLKRMGQNPDKANKKEGEWSKKIKKQAVKEGVSPETNRERRETLKYLENRHDEIIRRHKQGHSNEKIAKDMKLHPAIVSSSTGIMKEAWGRKKDPIHAMTSDEHINMIKHHTQQSRKFGNSLMGQMHARHAGRHAHYLLQKDDSVGAAKKALKALKEDAHKAKMDMVDREHAKALKKKGMVADHSEGLGPELCRASWCKHTGNMLHSWYENGKVKHTMVKEELTEGSKITPPGKYSKAAGFTTPAHKVLKWNPDSPANKALLKKKKKIKEDTELDEVSKGLINRYIDKTTKQDGSGGRKLGKGYNLALIKKHGGSRKGVTAKIRATESTDMAITEAKRGRPRKVQDAESNEHINMQLRKSITLRGQNHVAFGDGTKHQISPTLAHKALHMHDTMRTSIEKGEFAKRLAHSHNSFMDAVAGKPAAAAAPKITLGAGFGAKHIKK